jgi:DMSO/TMAO reductase YedYZ molybdopterin-dependent catalytic subunit
MGVRPRRTNLVLGGLLVVALLTGLGANTVGVDWPLDLIAVHAAAGFAVLLVVPWKSVIVRRGLRRRRGGRWWSVALLVAVAVTLLAGFAHATGLVEDVGPLSVMQVHVGGAVAALLLLVVHYAMHPVRPRRTDLDRRAFLGGAALAASAAVALTAWEGALDLSRLPGGGRRFTGSVERGTGDPGTMPVVSWLDDRTPALDPGAWRLHLPGRDLELAAVLALPHQDVRAVLDCTGGWYAEQTWSGVRLDHLVTAEPGTRSLLVRSATGYALHLPLTDLDNLWLVTAVAGRPLSRGHGYPARIAAPGRRGFWWVKWVVAIELSPRPWWLQSPFPLT